MLYNLFILNVFAAVLLTILGLRAVFQNIRQEDRSYMDPLPPALLKIWPLVRLLKQTLVEILPSIVRDVAEKQVIKFGVQHQFRGDDIIAIQMLAAIVAACIGAVLAVSMKMPVASLAMLGASFGLLLPLVKLRDGLKARELLIQKDLPLFLDYFNLCVNAGLNFSGAIVQTIDNAPDGPLKNEFRIVLREIRAGVDRASALMRLADRSTLPELRRLITAIVSAEARGTSLSAVLRVQSEQISIKRFQLAEQKAMQAPVKLMGPLVIFIFPVTFVVLLYPIAVQVAGQY